MWTNYIYIVFYGQIFFLMKIYLFKNCFIFRSKPGKFWELVFVFLYQKKRDDYEKR